MTWGAVAGSVVGLVGANQQKKAAQKAADRQQAAADAAAEQAAFNPYSVQGGAFGGVNFDQENNIAGFNLSPQMQQISDIYGQQALGFAGQGQTALGQQAGALGEQFLGGVQADPWAAAQTQFGRMEDVLAPSRQRQRESLEARLLKQGRLGSTGGALQQEGLETAFGNVSAQNLAQALGQSQAMTGQQAALGQQLGMFGQQQQDVGFNQAQARLGGVQGLEQQLFNMANLGSSLGGRQSAAGAQQGAFGMQGATSGTAALLGGAAGQAKAYGQIGSALGDYFDKSNTVDTGTAVTQTPYGTATSSPVPAATKKWWE